MENVVSLEQLDLRDQWIKQYIDARTKGGGGSSNYLTIRLCTRGGLPGEQFEDYGQRRLFIGFPAGTDVTGISIEHIRKSVVKNRYYDETEDAKFHKKITKWHKILAHPISEGKPLVVLTFHPEELLFTESGYDYYEVFGIANDTEYPMNEYVNLPGFRDDPSDTNDIFETGYFGPFEMLGEEQWPKSIGQLLQKKAQGIVAVRNEEYISNVVAFRSQPYEHDEERYPYYWYGLSVIQPNI